LRAFIIFVLLLSALLLSACIGETTITNTITRTQTITQQVEEITTTITKTQPLQTITATNTKTSITTVTIALPEKTTITETITLPATTITQTLTVIPLPPRLIWVEKSGSVVEFNYSAGILIGCIVYQCFEVSDGSGEVEISTIIGDTFGVPFIDNSEITNTFIVEEGGSYKLSIEVNIVAAQPSDPLEIKDNIVIIISSPVADSSKEVTIGEGYFHRVSLEQMHLEPWQ